MIDWYDYGDKNEKIHKLVIKGENVLELFNGWRIVEVHYNKEYTPNLVELKIVKEKEDGNLLL